MVATFVVENGTGLGSVITAGAFVVGLTYTITTIGTTDFTAIGATANTVGLEFVSTGVGTGTGTATIVTPANSYLSIADADQYHDNHDAPTAWSGATDAAKEQALRSGTKYLDEHYAKKWKGVRATGTNPLDWPRAGVVDTDGYSVKKNELPVALEDATAQAALRALDTTQNPTGLTPDITEEGIVTLKREEGFEIGEEETRYAGGFSPYVTFTEVDQTLHDLVKSSSSVTR